MALIEKVSTEDKRLIVVFDEFQEILNIREGICGMCSLYINGTPHGKTERGATTCQLYMRRFNDGDVITVEPWRSAAFPVIKDCMVDRNAFDKIMQLPKPSSSILAIMFFTRRAASTRP